MRLSIPAVAALAAVASALSEPSIKCYENDRLCLTSFVWCDRGKGNALDCFYPPGTRPLGVETATAAVFRDRKHSLSWTGSFLPTGEPVELAWLFAPIDSDDVQRLWAMSECLLPPYYLFTPEKQPLTPPLKTSQAPTRAAPSSSTLTPSLTTSPTSTPT